MSKLFGYVMFILGVAGICLDAIWIVQLTINFGGLAIPNSPQSINELMIIFIIVFLAISGILTYLGVKQIKAN